MERESAATGVWHQDFPAADSRTEPHDRVPVVQLFQGLELEAIFDDLVAVRFDILEVDRK